MADQPEHIECIDLVGVDSLIESLVECIDLIGIQSRNKCIDSTGDESRIECIDLTGEETIAEFVEETTSGSMDETADDEDWPCMLHWPYILSSPTFPDFLILVHAIRAIRDQQYENFIDTHVLNCDDMLTLESTKLGICIEFTKVSDNFVFLLGNHTPKDEQFVLPFASDVKRGKYVLTVEAMRNLLTQPFRHASKPTLFLRPDYSLDQFTIQFKNLVELHEGHSHYNFYGYLKPTPSDAGTRLFPDLRSVLEHDDKCFFY